MKMYSDDSVTREHVQDVVSTSVTAATSALDQKQSRQIMQLRIAVGVTFALNLIITLALFL